MSDLHIGPNVDLRADVASLQLLHDRHGTWFPISGDLIARAKEKTAKALAGPAVEFTH